MSFDDDYDSDLSDAESDEYRDYKTGRTGIIFLIDARPSMFQNRNGNIYFQTCIEVCRRSYINKMMNPDSVMIGVILYGTRIPDKFSNPKGITTVIELVEPCIEAIQSLQEIANRKGLEEFDTKIGHSDDFSIADALWYCSSSFSKCNTKFGKQHIILFTNDGNPHKYSQSKQHQTRKKAEDLSQLGISLEVYFMGTVHDNIDKAFYKELVEIANGDSGDWRIPDPLEKCEDLLQYVLKEDHRKRAIGRIKFHLGDDLCIGVAVYSFIRRATGPPKVLLYNRTNERVKSVRQQISMATGEVMLPSDIKTKVSIGGKDVYFTMSEKKKISQVMEPGITLLGFKPTDKVCLLDQYRPCSFLYPEEEIVEGSRLLFSALLKKCSEKNVVAICWMTARKGTHPHLVALLPQKEVLDEKGNQRVPEGFHVIYLPFAEYLRDIPLETQQEPSEEQIDITDRVLMRLETEPQYLFVNAKIKTLENAIRALALGEPQPEAAKDGPENVQNTLDCEMGFMSEAYLKQFPDTSVQATKKRSSETSSQYKAKVSKQDNDEEIDIPALADKKKIEMLKVTQLKSYLMGKNITVTGLKKAELVTLVYATVKKYTKP